MRKFKKGDHVKVISLKFRFRYEIPDNILGASGKIDYIYAIGDAPIRVNFIKPKKTFWHFPATALKLIKPKKEKTMKSLYVVSSTEFENLAEAEDQVRKWHKTSELNVDARVYKVSKVYDIATTPTLVERKRGRPRNS